MNLTKKLQDVSLNVVRAVVKEDVSKLDVRDMRTYQGLDALDRLFIKLTFAEEISLTDTEKELRRVCLKWYQENGIKVPNCLKRIVNG